LSSVGWKHWGKYTGSMAARPTAFITWSKACHVQYELQTDINCQIIMTPLMSILAHKVEITPFQKVPHQCCWSA